MFLQKLVDFQGTTVSYIQEDRTPQTSWLVDMKVHVDQWELLLLLFIYLSFFNPFWYSLWISN
jgi:hypothetical protein